MLTIITPTGERPEAFALAQRMLARQTYQGPVHWIVVDDGEVPTPVTLRRDGWAVDVIRPQPFWSMGNNTQGRNLKAGLELIQPGALLTIWEDDDWYAPDWLDQIAAEAHHADLIGEGRVTYYNVASRRWHRFGNDQHTSLRCTAMQGPAIETFRKVLEVPDPYYDLKLWHQHGNKHVFRGRHTVGIKGMPGRQGIAEGHSRLSGSPDPNLRVLRDLIGDDADWYTDFYRELGLMQQRLICAVPFAHNGKSYRPGQEVIIANDDEAELLITAGKIRRKTFMDRGAKTMNQEAKIAHTEKKAEQASDKEGGAEPAPKERRTRSSVKAD